jgi:hypothetical protein
MVGSGKRPHLSAVDNTGRRVDSYEDRMSAQEEREWKAHLRRERSGAYWFAATKWGMLGLVSGMILGGLGMYYASTATLDLAQDAVTKGAIVERLRQEQERQSTPVTPAP